MLSLESEAMITRTTPLWQRQLQEGVSDLRELLEMLGLEIEQLGLPEQVAEAVNQFPLKVPRGFIARMNPKDPQDPLLRQVLPLGSEMTPASGFSCDPLEESHSTPARGVLHKYRGRALLVVTGACGIHCRYCFRRHFPYGDSQLGNRQWQEALDYIASTPSIDEVILSGGDPLVARDEVLSRLCHQLEEIPHLRRLRVHTRMPIVLPQRVSELLLDWLCGSRLQPVVVLHANHGNEIDGEVRSAANQLRQAGVTVLNQAVLLRGVNDSVDALENLSRSLFDAGVLPYYLHLLDPVAGAAHFDLEENHARSLVTTLAERLPGYLVPRLVREVPGAGAKVPVSLEDQNE
ncbi:MAG: EF-P beta-lysylation protein EpmB [Deltaproteobacteria bacterium]|nr:EF-P beta-lysylation protein EpmB [Deltaproteobacteria bacterium]